ncbi:unnamed protein product [Protopolystoma xenopodis]|uniref:Secreted protein n=1 Tax=Protopolystoma xenopodis TaxID=117903 RepID=A0A448XIB8_9PLAT|nr:unnamed protein product [Protopolystoma xenopodis]
MLSLDLAVELVFSTCLGVVSFSATCQLPGRNANKPLVQRKPHLRHGLICTARIPSFGRTPEEVDGMFQSRQESRLDK